MPTKPKRYTFTPANANLTGFASNVTGASFTLTANNSGDDLAHQVSIRNDTANSHAGKTIALVGTDPDGKAITEDVTGPGANATVESTKYFKTLTSATPSATIGTDTFDIGWVDEFVSQTIPFNWRGLNASLDFVVSGTIDYTGQYTPSLIQTEEKPFDWKDSNDSDIVNATTNQTSNITDPVMATRVKVSSYSSGASVIYSVIQMNEDA